MKQSNKNVEGYQAMKLMVIVSKHTNWDHYIVQVSVPPRILLSYTVVILHHLKGKE